MKRIRKFIICICLLSMVVYQTTAQAQAMLAPVENFVVNRAVGSVITRVALSRGFAANDPRIAATLAGVGSASTALNVAATVAGVGLSLAGAPVWLTIAAGLGVFAVGAAIVAATAGNNSSISIDGTANGNKLRVDQPQPTPMPYTTPQIAEQTYPWQLAVTQGAPIYRSPSGCYSNQACYALPILPNSPGYQYNSDPQGQTVMMTTDLQAFGRWYTMLTQPTLAQPPGVTFTWQFAGAQQNYNSNGGSQVTVTINESRSGGDDQGLPSYSRVDTFNNVGSVSGNIGPQWYDSLDKAWNGMPTAVKTAQLSADTLAKIVDQSWKLAAQQPNYQGLPYSVTQPVTATDVSPWALQNPSAVPTINDLLAPANNPGTSTVPISPTVTPGTVPNPNPVPDPNPTPTPGTTSNVNVVNTPNVNVTNKVSVDFGPDPGTAAPSLESTPTAKMILDPLLNLFPSLQKFVVPSHSSECPKPSMSMFGKTFALDGHCALLETVRPTLYAVMAFVWIVIALFIVLAA